MKPPPEPPSPKASLPPPLATLVEGTPWAMMLADRRGRVQLVNEAFVSLTGFSSSEMVGEGARGLISERHSVEFIEGLCETVQREGKWQGEIWIGRKDGVPVPLWATVCALPGDDGSWQYHAVMFWDSAGGHASEGLLFLAYHDPLTHLPNRRLFKDRLERAIARAKRNRTCVGLLLLDLDDFKTVNDRFSHSVGDRLLRAVAHLIKNSLRESDTVGRYGGDEFTVVCEDLDGLHGAKVVASKLVQRFSRPIHIDGNAITVGVSIGVALYPDDACEIPALIAMADEAMYRVKAAGKRGYQTSS